MEASSVFTHFTAKIEVQFLCATLRPAEDSSLSFEKNPRCFIPCWSFYLHKFGDSNMDEQLDALIAAYQDSISLVMSALTGEEDYIFNRAISKLKDEFIKQVIELNLQYKHRIKPKSEFEIADFYARLGDKKHGR
jgi:hypothetical protein